MQQKPFYSFSSPTETGLQNIPINSVIQIEDPITPTYIIIINISNVSSTLSIEDFMTNYPNDYKYLSSGFPHEYDDATHTLTIIIPLVDISDFEASDNVQNVINISFTQNGADQYDLYDDSGTLLVSDFPTTRSGAELNTLNYTFTPPSGGGTYTLKVKSTFRNFEAWSNENAGTALNDPGPINDLIASDNDLGQVTITWTDSQGHPVPTQEIWAGPPGSEISLQTNVSSPYVDTYVGTRDYFVEARNSTGLIKSNIDQGTGWEIPGTITDFTATDSQLQQIIMNWTPTTGHPVPTYNLWDSSGVIQFNITPGYVHTFIGTETFYVQAVNAAALHPNGINSNADQGTALNYLELYLLDPANPNSVFLDAFIAANNPTNRVNIKVINQFTQPRIRSGDLSGLNVLLENNSEIQGNIPGREALELTSPLQLINNGWIRGAGGSGGRGGICGIGGTGGNSSDRVETQWPTSFLSWSNRTLTPASSEDGWLYHGSPYLKSPCGNQVSWNQSNYANNSTYRASINAQLVNMCGNEGNETTPVFNYNSSGVYSISISAGREYIYGNKVLPGRAGGTGTSRTGSPGTGDFFGMGGYHPATLGTISPAVPAIAGTRTSNINPFNSRTYYGYLSGNSGNNGASGKGGNGGTWGNVGGTGTIGSAGSAGHPSEDGNAGSAPQAPQAAQTPQAGGYSIKGSSNLIPGSITGNVNGIII